MSKKIITKTCKLPGEIWTYIRKAEKFLELNHSNIYTELFIVHDKKGNRHLKDKVYQSEIKYGIELGYYNPESDEIYIATYHPYHDVMLSPDRLLFSILHELRHRWQYTKDPHLFDKNSYGVDCYGDPSEIDADGFAIAFMCIFTSYDSDSYRMDLPSESFAIEAREHRAQEIISSEFGKEPK